MSWDRSDRFDEAGFGSRALDLSRRCWRTRSFGDFWHHVLVADGSLDIAVEPSVAVWDVAGVVPIVVEAGGRFTDRSGEARADGGSAVSTNGLLHDEVIADPVPRSPGASALVSPVVASTDITVGIDIGLRR